MKITRKSWGFIALLVIMFVAGQYGVFNETSLGMIATILMIVGGLAVLILGGDSLVEGSHSIADYYDIPPLIVGMTILAVGTSAPELFVNMIAAFRGETGLMLANIVGSNISNLMLIGGITAVITALAVKPSTLFKELPMSFGAALILLIMINDQWLWGSTESMLSRTEGIILLLFFAGFLRQLFVAAKNNEIEVDGAPVGLTLPYSYFLVILGAFGLYIGGEALVTHASSLARMFNVSTVLIGASIVAIGTSVPELVTSVIAALKKHTDMALGNIIGSNVFNILWIGGLTATIQPIAVNPAIRVDTMMLLGATFFVFLLIYFNKKRSLVKATGILMICCYLCYMGFLLWRG